VSPAPSGPGAAGARRLPGAAVRRLGARGKAGAGGRGPCATFAGWLDEKGWLRTFTRAARPGPYLRVVEPGDLAAGDALTVEFRPRDHAVSVALAFRALTTDGDLLPLLADLAALPAEDREDVRRRLSRPGH
jgi:MOSC domain-containing protein YiiM